MLSIKEIIECVNGKLINGNENIVPKKYVLDSRDVNGGEMFVPIVGENVDAHKYIVDVVKKGVLGYFINSDNEKKDEIISETIKINKDICVIEVKNSQNALYEAGVYNRDKHIDIPVIAITGSFGKTSTREMISSIFKEEKNVLVTEKNYNSCIGIPLVMLKLENQDICILEAGIDSFGEMELESKLLKPDAAIITNIGTAHIGTFGTMENTLSEKIQITNYIKGMKILLVNSDNNLLKKVENNDKYSVMKYSLDLVKDINQTKDGITICTKIYGKDEYIHINEIGIHNVQNAICAIKVAELFNISRDSIINGIGKYKNFSRRMERIKLKNNVLLIDDTYNASIDSMKSGLITLDGIEAKRKIAVLGDMFDLGDSGKYLHNEVGKLFSNINIDMLYTTGSLARNITENAKEYVKEAIHFDSKDKLILKVNEIIQDGDIVYFKASNAMNFNEIIRAVKNEND